MLFLKTYDHRHHLCNLGDSFSTNILHPPMRPPTPLEIRFWATHPIAVKVNTTTMNGETLTITKWQRTPTPTGVDEIIDGSDKVWHLNRVKGKASSYKLVGVTD